MIDQFECDPSNWNDNQVATHEGDPIDHKDIWRK